MALFGFKSSKEVEEEKRIAAQQAAKQAREEVVRNNMTNLSNLSKGSQVNFVIPFFDVSDPRFMDQSVPVSVRGSIVYSIDDMDMFRQLNKNEAYSDDMFHNKLKSQVAMYVKSVVSNAPREAGLPAMQLDQKIVEISELVHKQVATKVERTFGINVRSIDIVSLNYDKSSRNYRELKALTSDLERDRMQTQNRLTINNMEQQSDMNLELQRMQTIDAMKMQMEDQRERMRIQRDGIEMNQEQLIKDGRFGRHGGMMGGNPMMGGQPMGGGMMGGQPMGGGMMGGQPMGGGMMGGQPMGGMAAPPPMMSTQYYVGINGQQMGPFDMNTLRQYAQSGQMNAQTKVWTQGMPQWAPAGTVPELASLFTQQPMGTPPPMDGGTPPPMDGGSTPAPTL